METIKDFWFVVYDPISEHAVFGSISYDAAQKFIEHDQRYKKFQGLKPERVRITIDRITSR